MKTINKLSLSFLLVFGLTIPVAQAQSGPSMVASEEEAMAVLENRSEFMKGMGSAMRAFSNYLKRGDGEPLELGSMAADIAENASSIPDLFPKDTGMAQFEDSESKPNIWEQWDEFVDAANGLVEPAMAVEAAFESGDQGQIAASVKALGGNGCRTCHTSFREKKE